MVSLFNDKVADIFEAINLTFRYNVFRHSFKY